MILGLLKALCVDLRSLDLDFNVPLEMWASVEHCSPDSMFINVCETFQMNNFSFILRFGFVGGSTALLFLASTYLQVECLSISPVLASTLGLAFAIFYNYLMHYHWTYASEAPHRSALVRYLVMGVSGIMINGLIMYWGITLDSAHYMLAQICSAIALLCWSLCLSYFWVFK